MWSLKKQKKKMNHIMILFGLYKNLKMNTNVSWIKLTIVQLIIQFVIKFIYFDLRIESHTFHMHHTKIYYWLLFIRKIESKIFVTFYFAILCIPSIIIKDLIETNCYQAIRRKVIWKNKTNLTLENICIRSYIITIYSHVKIIVDHS